MYTADSLYKAEENIKEAIYTLDGISKKMLEMAERENIFEIIRCLNFNEKYMKCETIDIVRNVELTIEYCRRDTKAYYVIFNLSNDIVNLLKTSSLQFSRRYLAGMVALDEVSWELYEKIY